MVLSAGRSVCLAVWSAIVRGLEVAGINKTSLSGLLLRNFN